MMKWINNIAKNKCHYSVCIFLKVNNHISCHIGCEGHASQGWDSHESILAFESRLFHDLVKPNKTNLLILDKSNIMIDESIQYLKWFITSELIDNWNYQNVTNRSSIMGLLAVSTIN